MLTLNPATSEILVIDFQTRLMPVIHDADAIVNNAYRLIQTARLLDLRVTYTEQNPDGLGQTLPVLAPRADEVLHKVTFDATRANEIRDHLAGSNMIVVMGCEAHVCVLQTVLSLLDMGRQVFVVADAVGSRTISNHQAALDRMSKNGATVLTTEMVVFEWLGSSDHPSFREVVKLIK